MTADLIAGLIIVGVSLVIMAFLFGMMCGMKIASDKAIDEIHDLANSHKAKNHDII